ncbi:hypothetical protein [Trinickia sp.]|uniref:hypothetical protein n=1 Tax=Trinickia sp. TaxID=2571163 RepID=UPI003F8230DE
MILAEGERKFISAVQDSIRKVAPTLTDDPTLPDKLAEALAEAKAAGLTRDKLLADFIYLEMQVPGFHRHPLIRRWLRKRGAVPDERFAGLIEVLRNKSLQLQENK